MSNPTHPRRRTATSLALLVAACLMAMTACGQSASPAAAPSGADAKQASTATDPCTLVGIDELAEVLGTSPSQQGVAAAQARGLARSWTFADPGSAVGEGTLSITTWHGSEFFAEGTIGDPVPGLADEAQADPSSGVVLFRSGDEVVQVQVLSPVRRDRAVAVARAAAAAL